MQCSLLVINNSSGISKTKMISLYNTIYAYTPLYNNAMLYIVLQHSLITRHSPRRSKRCRSRGSATTSCHTCPHTGRRGSRRRKHVAPHSGRRPRGRCPYHRRCRCSTGNRADTSGTSGHTAHTHRPGGIKHIGTYLIRKV